MGMSLCVSVLHTSVCPECPEEVSQVLEQKLQPTVSRGFGVLGNKLGSPGRTASALNSYSDASKPQFTFISNLKHNLFYFISNEK